MSDSFKRLGIVDLETGEIVEDRAIFLGKRNRDKNYAKVFLAFLDSLVENDKIAGKSIRLLFYMVGNMKYDSLELKVIPKDAVKELGISEMTYNRWINDLIEFEVIEKIDRYTYKLKPYTFSRGDTSKAIKKKEKKNKRDKSKSKKAV